MPFDYAAALRGLNSPANVSATMGAFAPPAGRSLSAAEQYGLDNVRDQASEAMGAGPAFHALTQALDRQKYAHTTEELNARDDLASGIPHDIAMQQAGIHNDVGDVVGEGDARRQFMPFASALHDRNMGDVLSRGEVQYGYPAMVKANADLERARIAGNAQVQAAGAHDASLPVRGLMDAINAIINKTGKPPDEATMAALRPLFQR